MMAYTPLTTIQPNLNAGKDKLKELLDFLQGDIQNKMRMDQYKKGLEAEKLQKEYGSGIATDPKSFGFTNLNPEDLSKYSNLPVNDLLETAKRLNTARATDQEATLEQQRINNLIELTKNDPRGAETIKYALNAGMNAEEATKLLFQRDRQEEIDARIIANSKKGSGGSSGNGEPLLSEMKGKNIKTAYRTTGMVTEGNNVYIKGSDAKPYALLSKGNGTYSLKNGKYYFTPKNGKPKAEGESWSNGIAVTIPQDVKASLMKAISTFQTSNIDAMGKNTITPSQQPTKQQEPVSLTKDKQAVFDMIDKE